MVVRQAFECSTCNKRFTLRVGIGHEVSQRHIFLCPYCEEECSISIDVDSERARTAISDTNNCCVIEDVSIAQTRSWPIINVHPDYIVPFAQRNVDHSFPWLEDMSRMYERLQKYDSAKSRFKDLRELINFNNSFLENWQTLTKAWSLFNGEKCALSAKILDKYKWLFPCDKASLFAALADFSRGMLFPSRLLLLDKYENFRADVELKHSDGMAVFVDFYKKNLHKENFHAYKGIFDEYFGYFSEFKQTLNYIRCDLELPAGSFASSRGFNRVKMFYGNAFEVLASDFVVPACLNNIYRARDFDKFERMDLDKYLSLDKASRGTAFKQNDRINFLLDGIDTTIRNASHHGSIKLLKGRDAIEYRSGGRGARRQMTYAQYIHSCNTLVMNLFVMFSIELRLIV